MVRFSARKSLPVDCWQSPAIQIQESGTHPSKILPIHPACPVNKRQIGLTGLLGFSFSRRFSWVPPLEGNGPLSLVGYPAD